MVGGRGVHYLNPQNFNLGSLILIEEIFVIDFLWASLYIIEFWSDTLGIIEQKPKNDNVLRTRGQCYGCSFPAVASKMNKEE